MKQLTCTISYNEEIMPEVHLLAFESQFIASKALPGQFITINCNDVLLRRPFSIHQINSDQVYILFQKVGKGTNWLSMKQKGTKLDILGPLGSAFNIKTKSKHLLLIGGGLGIAPLIYFIQRTLPEHSITLVHGASTARLNYPLSSVLVAHTKGKEITDKSNLSLLDSGLQYIPVTDDGSSVRKGLATDVILDFIDWADQVFACGPVNMYMTMSTLRQNIQILHPDAESVKCYQVTKEKLDKCQISLEMMMGCGMGTCYGCSINTLNGMQKVCSDGPVFELAQIIRDELLS